MATKAYFDWKAAGAPWSPATPIADFSRTMRGHRYTVYILGADDPTHLQANLPEDHCPFSQTPWPGKQPYPRVMALDIMPGGEMDWRALGEKIVADKNAGVPGTEWIKYVNYTDGGGNVWHAEWAPGYARRPSSDGGHIHISGRTDFVDAHTAYDPFAAPARAQEGIEMFDKLSKANPVTGGASPAVGGGKAQIRLASFWGHSTVHLAVRGPKTPAYAKVVTVKDRAGFDLVDIRDGDVFTVRLLSTDATGHPTDDQATFCTVQAVRNDS